jgi:hypothetical protein
MKCTALAVVLLALTTACGSSSHNAGSSSVPPSIAGSWNVGLTQNGTTASFQATLVSEPAVNSTYGVACNLSTQAGVITEAAGQTLTGCYVADSLTDQGSFTPSGIFTLQGMLIETEENRLT